jgi:hypothetical protein
MPSGTQARPRRAFMEARRVYPRRFHGLSSQTGEGRCIELSSHIHSEPSKVSGLNFVPASGKRGRRAKSHESG